MADTYSDLLRLRKQADGANDSTWGSLLNTTLEMIEDSISGRAAVTHDDSANYTLTTANGTTDEARCMIINVGGALGAARNVVCPTSAKLYVVKNATTGGFAFTFKTTAGTGISVPNGKTMILFCDGTNVVDAIDQINGNLAVAGLTATGNVTLGDNVADTFRVTSDAIAVAAAGSGGQNSLSVTNLNNTASSRATGIISVAGTSAGDADLQFVVTGTTTWSMGLDNSDSDKFKISASSALGTSDALDIDTSLNATFRGTLQNVVSYNGACFTAQNGHATTPNGAYIYFQGGSPNNTTQYFLRCDDNIGAKAYIYSNGTYGSATNTYGAIVSERQFKQDIVKAGSQWNDVKAIAALTSKFRFKSEPDAHLQMGWIVDEIEKVSPGLVMESRQMEKVEIWDERDAETGVLDEKGNKVMRREKFVARVEEHPTGPIRKGLKTSIIYMKAVKALGEAMERIEALEARLSAAGIK